MVVYYPTERVVEERERFRNDVDNVVDRLCNGYCIACVCWEMWMVALEIVRGGI